MLRSHLKASFDGTGVIAPAPEPTPAEHGVLGEEMAHLVRHNELMETLHQEKGQGRGVQEEEKVPSQHAQNLKQGHTKSGSKVHNTD